MISREYLAPFIKRVRFLYALRGLWLGVLSAGIIALLWSLLDARGVIYAEWQWLVSLIAVGATVGAAIGGLIKPSEQAVAQSLDRRANLKDRVSTALELSDDQDYASAVRADAIGAINETDPKEIFPARWGWLQSSGIGSASVAFLIFALSSSSILSLANTPTQQEEMKKEAARLDNLRKAIFDDGSKKKTLSADLQQLQKDLMRLQKDYEKAKIDPKQALIRKEELAKQVAELSKQKATDALDDIKKCESALEKLEKAELEKAGMKDVNMSDVHMDQSDFDQKMQASEQRKDNAAKQVDKMQKNLDLLSQQLQKPGLSESERKELQKQMEEARKALDAAKKELSEAEKQLANMKLSQEARDVLAKLQNDPLMKEIQKELERLRQKMKDAAKGEEDNTWKPKLTKEQMAEMRKKIEAFLKSLKDDKAREEYLKELLEALKKAEELGQCQGLGMGLGAGLGLGMGGPGPGPDNDRMLLDSGMVNKSDPIQGKGKGTPTFAPTDRDPLRPGPEMTFEIKAPTFKGTRSSVPYEKVLPSYKKKAESALKKQDIPKQHQARVKRYFDSLSK